MRHTIVIELPDGADGETTENIVTRRLEMTYVSTTNDEDGNLNYGALKVIEYHHEQMTETASDYVVEELPSRTGFAIRNISTGELIMDGVMPLLRHTREATEVEAEYLRGLHA